MSGAEGARPGDRLGPVLGSAPGLPGRFLDGAVDPVEEVGQRDLQVDRADLFLGEMGVGLFPDLIGDALRTLK
jgi:hypothetical protein